jgi:hypothetical protein
MIREPLFAHVKLSKLQDVKALEAITLTVYLHGFGLGQIDMLGLLVLVKNFLVGIVGLKVKINLGWTWRKIKLSWTCGENK